VSIEPAQVTGQEALKVPVYEEQALVDKRVVDTGRGVRIHKIVAEHPCHIDESLTHDEVQVSHVPVDRIVALDQAPATRYEGDTLVVPILEEVLVVERRLRIKEELRITRTRREERHAETVMLKAEQVSVERFDDAGDGPSTSLED
jgi:stress response protein YsnF